jgi:hypothetical protein
MIIEGKHAEVGQGIFVSDIQQDSNAEKVLKYIKITRNNISPKLFFTLILGWFDGW